jgi:uncharacterized protein with HEPN domain
VAKAQKFLAGMTYEQFAADEKTAFAVVRCLEILGEAARKIPEFIRTRYPQAPWREMTGMRDVLIHDYFGVNLRVVWNTVQKDLPPLKLQIEQIIADNS